MTGTTSAIVIPCFNEAERLDTKEVLRLGSATGVRVILVNDGSTDATASVLEEIASTCPVSFEVLHLADNQGKAEAVRQGLLHVGSEVELVGFLDADLSTPVDEMLRLISVWEEWRPEILLGSRVALAGRAIDRHPSRHYLGRLFATVASSLVLGETIYDTQCGAKLFTNSELLANSLEVPFRSRWSFDVELLGRMLAGAGDQPALSIDQIREEPLRVWNDVAGSKIRPAGMIKSGLELLLIKRDLQRWSGESALRT